MTSLRNTALRPRPLLLALILGVVFATAGCSGAQASTPTVGIGDNNFPMFYDKNYTALNTKISRKIIAYDFYHYKAARDDLKAWMEGAKSAGVEPLIAFNHSVKYPKKLPTVRSYQNSLRYLLKNYPELKNFSVWNEANHRSQPTRDHPIRAAEYYNTARKICRGCKIVAADVLDQANMLPWIKAFRTKAYKPKLWGLHSYIDVNRNASYARSSARQLLGAVPGDLWLTEIGGIVAFARTYSYNESRAAQGVKNTLKIAQGNSRIKRVYLYAWYGSPQKHRKPYLWDSGLVSAGSVPRPGYYAVRNWLKTNPRALTVK